MSAGRLILAGAAALMMTTGAGTLVAQSKNELPASLGDLKTAQLVEVRDQSGQVLLHGLPDTAEQIRRIVLVRGSVSDEAIAPPLDNTPIPRRNELEGHSRRLNGEVLCGLLQDA